MITADMVPTFSFEESDVAWVLDESSLDFLVAEGFFTYQEYEQAVNVMCS